MNEEQIVSSDNFCLFQKDPVEKCAPCSISPKSWDIWIVKQSNNWQPNPKSSPKCYQI